MVQLSNKVLSAWERVKIARHPQRPFSLDFIRGMTEEFVELHGDRCLGDDKAIVGGVARFAGRTVMIVGQQKGRDTKEKLERNFGMPAPEGFRKGRRLMQQAEKFGFPVITLLDTPGASPDVHAEQYGQAQVIAENLYAMAKLKVPIVALVIGEANSGGALAIGVADRVIMLEHAYFSVVSPEGCASILWHDTSHAPEAAEAMRITAGDLMALGLIDRVVPEPAGGAQVDPRATIERAGEYVAESLAELCEIAQADLLARRYERYRSVGRFFEKA
ncbi:MAG: acetyl-CoA carboxylase carboxyltransferase subunit alpha [Chloroflexi bacterium]|nr:acetyl-CoA carboxylase carboxyltransferase subunit alpha [Chloroflexota bacterium]